ncbi:MAG: hypothetical protein QXP68_02300 [Thermosphaera sp.]
MLKWDISGLDPESSEAGGVEKVSQSIMTREAPVPATGDGRREWLP